MGFGIGVGREGDCRGSFDGFWMVERVLSRSGLDILGEGSLVKRRGVRDFQIQSLTPRPGS
jgi:hypothetical protein